MMHKKFLLAGAVSSILLLGACGGGGSESSANKAATTPGPGNTTAAGNQVSASTNTPAQKAAAPAPDDTTTTTGVTLAQHPGDAAAGESVFAQCRTCHVTEPGVNRIGPSLAGIVGREAGKVQGYQYTPANANSGITWSPEKLFQYLENPQRVVPGTKMAFAGIRDPQQRANLIAWLGTQK
jgi:cytochrome c